MTRKTLLMLAVLAALSAGTAFAATTPTTDDSRPASRATLDTNGDGVIDRSEAGRHPRLAGRFDDLDKNKDGKLAKEEMPRRHGGGFGRNGHGQGEMMKKLDADKDGRISSTESAAGEGKLASRFDRIDVNKDGYIDRADHEIRARQRTDEWFAKADSDKDGKLSRAELDASKARRKEHRGPRSPEKSVN